MYILGHLQYVDEDDVSLSVQALVSREIKFHEDPTLFYALFRAYKHRSSTWATYSEYQAHSVGYDKQKLWVQPIVSIIIHQECLSVCGR